MRGQLPTGSELQSFAKLLHPTSGVRPHQMTAVTFADLGLGYSRMLGSGLLRWQGGESRYDN